MFESAAQFLWHTAFQRVIRCFHDLQYLATSVRFVKKNSGGRRLASAEGARVEAPQAPRGVGPTRGSGGAS